MTIKEIAVSYSLPTKYVRRLVNTGQIPAIKAGRAYVIAPEDAEAAIKGIRAEETEKRKSRQAGGKKIPFLEMLEMARKEAMA